MPDLSRICLLLGDAPPLKPQSSVPPIGLCRRRVAASRRCCWERRTNEVGLPKVLEQLLAEPEQWECTMCHWQQTLRLFLGRCIPVLCKIHSVRVCLTCLGVVELRHEV